MALSRPVGDPRRRVTALVVCIVMATTWLAPGSRSSSATVDSDPVDTTAFVGEPATFTASRAAATSVSWERQRRGGSWEAVPDSSTSTLSVTAAATEDGTKFRAVFQTPGGAVTTPAATLTVDLSRADSVSWDFAHTATEQTFTVPAGFAFMDVALVGGKGANPANNLNYPGGVGGAGAHIVARTADPVSGTNYIVRVGGNGSNPCPQTDVWLGGGWNGGGAVKRCGATGGGATDIRTLSASAAGSLESRVVVAGGGGGAGGRGFTSQITRPGGPGGPAGALANLDGSPGGTVTDGFSAFGGGGGTATAGGAAGIFENRGEYYQDGTAGGFGYGGTSSSVYQYSWFPQAGGGGGGWYGGGGGAQHRGYLIDWPGAAGGGGGSSYVAPGFDLVSIASDTTGVPTASITMRRATAPTITARVGTSCDTGTTVPEADIVTSTEPVTICFGNSTGALGATFTTFEYTTDGTFPDGGTTSTGSSLSISTPGDWTVKVRGVDANGLRSALGALSFRLQTSKASQTISFADPADLTYGETTTLTATSTSGLTVSFAASGSCTLSGATLTASEVGTCTVTASQAGDDDAEPAAPVVHDISVGALPITLTAVTDSRVYDDSVSSTGTPTVARTGSGAGFSAPFGDVIVVAQSFDAVHVGARTLTPRIVSIRRGGTDVSANYTVTTATTSGSITRATLVIAAVAERKLYDGTATATSSPQPTGLRGDDTITAEQVFDSAELGERTLSVSTYAVQDGNDGQNYTVSTTTAAGRILPEVTVVQLTRRAALVTSGNVLFDLTFDRTVTGLAADDISVSAGSTSTGCAPSVSGSSDTYVVTLTGCSDGTVVAVLAAGAVVDRPSHTAPSTAITSLEVTVDRTGPTVDTLSITPSRMRQSKLRPFTITAGVSDVAGIDGVDWRFNGGEWTPMQATGTPTSTSGSFEAIHELTVTSGIVQLAPGNEHTCALSAAGEVWCWGSNYSGELGRGYTGPSDPVPQKVTGLGAVTSIAAGFDHTCAITVTGTVMCWGSGWAGQLGNGYYASSSFPVTVSLAVGTLPPAVQVVAGSNHTCAISAAGAVGCWGGNWSGQLGNGTTSNSPRPVQVIGATGITRLASGTITTCGLEADGDVVCWGDNYQGNLGRGNTGGISTIATSNLASKSSAIAMGTDHGCVLTTAGTVQCWGNNYLGQAGQAQGVHPVATPTTVSGVSGVTALSAGSAHTCADVTGGATWCWGVTKSMMGYYFPGDTDGSLKFTPGERPVPGAASVWGGNEHSCMIGADGTVTCWGANSQGQVGATPSMSAPATTVQGLPQSSGFEPGDYPVCVIARDGNGTAGSQRCTTLSILEDDVTPPTATFTLPSTPTAESSVVFQLIFSENVTGVTAGDLSVSGTSSGCSLEVSPTDAMTYTVTATGCGDGTVVLSLAASSVSDEEDNVGPTAIVSSDAVLVDRTGPVIARVSLDWPTVGTGLPVVATTSATDAAGVAKAELRVGAGAWTTISFVGTTSVAVQGSFVAPSQAALQWVCVRLTDILGTASSKCAYLRTVVLLATTLTVETPSEVDPAGPVTVQVQLKDANGSAIANRAIDVSLGSSTARVTTDVRGTARAALTAPTVGGTATVNAQFAYTAAYAASQASGTVTVRTGPQLAYVGPRAVRRGALMYLACELTAAGGAKVAGARIRVMVGDALYTLTTGTDGVARRLMAAPATGKSLPVVCMFTGDSVSAPAMVAVPVLLTA